MNGFYRSQYKNKEGETKHMAVTQFEACDARQAFPCWDEPSVKATFAISMVVPFELEALSNMPIKEMTAVEPDVKTVYFETTPIMSTYVSVPCRFDVLLLFLGGRREEKVTTETIENGPFPRVTGERLCVCVCVVRAKKSCIDLLAYFFPFSFLWRCRTGPNVGMKGGKGRGERQHFPFRNKNTNTPTQTNKQYKNNTTASIRSNSMRELYVESLHSRKSTKKWM